MRSLTVLLSAAGSPTMPGQLRCFKNNGERDIRIIGVDMADDPTIKFMVDKYYRVPEATNERYVDTILDICRNEKVDVYFPNISVEVSAVSERVDDFYNIGTKVSIAEQSVVELLNNKLHAYDFLHKQGLTLPDYYPVHSISDFETGCKRLGFPNNPVCIKLVSNSGSRGVRIIAANKNRYQIFAHEKPNSFFTSYEDMLSILKSVPTLEEMMLVEYMPGNEYTVDLLADNGKVQYMVGRENVVSLMSIAQKSIVTKVDSAYEMCEKIVSLLNYTGNIGFDFMKNAYGEPLLMDINPRLTATVSVIAAAGVNLPYLRIKQLLGEKMPECNVDYGTTLVRRYGEYIIDSAGNLSCF